MPSAAPTVWANQPRIPGISNVISAPLSPQDKDSEPPKMLQSKESRLLSRHGGHGQDPTFIPQEKGRSIVGQRRGDRRGSRGKCESREKI